MRIKTVKYTLIFLLATATALTVLSCSEKKNDLNSVASPRGTEIYSPDWDSIAKYYRFPEWFIDGKFGIFIHWGVYSVPAFASEWYPRYMYQQDTREYRHHIATYGEHTKFGYKDFIPLFKAEKFDADEWAALFLAAGAKYVVPVAEHHDGFAMYDSDLNPWNAVDMGPKRDIVGLLKKAVEKRGLVFGVSTHRAENAWFFNQGMKFPSDVQDTTITLYGQRLAADASTSESAAKDWLAHTRELTDKYQPSLVWFDWTVNNPVMMPWFNRFMAYYYNCAIDWGKQVTINTKQGYPTNIQVWDIERGKTDKMMKFPWQNDTFIGTKSWGYISDEVYKTPQQIVHDLIDIVSKNGNMLLNISPCADGTIPDEQKRILLEIGDWLRINGEAIYGTRCWKKSGEGDAVTTKGSFSDNVASEFTSRDIRFTCKNADMYAIALNWNDDGIVITSLDSLAIGDATIRDVKLLGSDDKIEWMQKPEALHIKFPAVRPCKFAYSFKITFDKQPGASLPSEAVNETLKHGG